MARAGIRPGLRYGIYIRDNFTCVWCGTKEPLDITLDHAFNSASPWRSNAPRHLFTACGHCNRSRGVRRFATWLRVWGPAALARVRAARSARVDRKAGRAFYRSIKESESSPLAGSEPMW